MVAAFLIAAVIALFTPLAIAGVEYYAFHTSHFEDWLRKLGLHHALSEIYRPIVDAIRWVLNRVF